MNSISWKIIFSSIFFLMTFFNFLKFESAFFHRYYFFSDISLMLQWIFLVWQGETFTWTVIYFTHLLFSAPTETSCFWLLPVSTWKSTPQHLILYFFCFFLVSWKINIVSPVSINTLPWIPFPVPPSHRGRPFGVQS